MLKLVTLGCVWETFYRCELSPFQSTTRLIHESYWIRAAVCVGRLTLLVPLICNRQLLLRATIPKRPILILGDREILSTIPLASVSTDREFHSYFEDSAMARARRMLQAWSVFRALPGRRCPRTGAATPLSQVAGTIWHPVGSSAARA